MSLRNKSGSSAVSIVLCTQFMHIYSRSRASIKTLASLQYRDGTRPVFTDQAGIACTTREAPVRYSLSRYGRGGGGGRGGLICGSPLSHLTIDHASLSRRSTVPIPSIDTPPPFGRSVRLFHILHEKIVSHLLAIWPSVVTIYRLG